MIDNLSSILNLSFKKSLASSHNVFIPSSPRAISKTENAEAFVNFMSKETGIELDKEALAYFKQNPDDIESLMKLYSARTLEKYRAETLASKNQSLIGVGEIK